MTKPRIPFEPFYTRARATAEIWASRRIHSGWEFEGLQDHLAGALAQAAVPWILGLPIVFLPPWEKSDGGFDLGHADIKGTRYAPAYLKTRSSRRIPGRWLVLCRVNLGARFVVLEGQLPEETFFELAERRTSINGKPITSSCYVLEDISALAPFDPRSWI